MTEEAATIRRAIEADVKEIGRFGAALMALHHEWDADRFIPSGSGTPEAYTRWLRNQIGKEDVVPLVACAAGRVVGYVLAEVEGYDYMSLRGPAGVIHDLFVEPASRRSGLGRRLLQAAVEELAARGARQIVLSTAFKNEAAQRLFSSAGFRPTMVEMTRTLNA